MALRLIACATRCQRIIVCAKNIPGNHRRDFRNFTSTTPSELLKNLSAFVMNSRPPKGFEKFDRNRKQEKSSENPARKPEAEKAEAPKPERPKASSAKNSSPFPPDFQDFFKFPGAGSGSGSSGSKGEGNNNELYIKLAIAGAVLSGLYYLNYQVKHRKIHW